jgi:hypothetical protein
MCRITASHHTIRACPCFSVDIAADAVLVREHVTKHHAATFREPAGIMRFKYLVPSGFYTQLWDWDASHMGVGLLSFGGAPYLRGSMTNFLDHVCVIIKGIDSVHMYCFIS